MTLSDGRTLAFHSYGDPDGTPVIFSHGFSDSHVIRNTDDGLTASLGVRWIAADEPGVGGSSPKPGRRMVDWGADMEALASPVAPFDEPGVTKMLVMKDLKTIAKVRYLHRLIRFAERTGAKKVLKDVPSYVESVADELPDEAKTMLRNPAQKALFEENFRLGYMQEEEGVYEMTLALWDWGFAPGDIGQPVDIFYGTADDILSPKMSQHLCAELPHCTAHAWPGAPHYGFIDRDNWIPFVKSVATVPG